VSALLLFLFALVDFVFIGLLDRSYLSKRNKTSIGPTPNASTSAWTTPCQKSSPNSWNWWGHGQSDV